jgi:sugar (pentulose or hexulose) kinase
MERELFLGFDVGTQGTKALLFDPAARRVIARASSSYGLIEGLPEGAAEQHPETWIEAVRACSAPLFAGRDADKSCVAGSGVAGPQDGCKRSSVNARTQSHPPQRCLAHRHTSRTGPRGRCFR